MTLTAETVPAREVREGDWVRWPETSGVMRKVTETSSDSDVERGRVYARLYCEDDDYEYDLLSTQTVEVWRA